MTIIAVLIPGVWAGYISLALGPVGWVLVSILMILVVGWLRRRPLRLGPYFVLLGATGASILVPLVIGSQACPVASGGGVIVLCDSPHACAATCYAPSTLPALLAYFAVLLVGVILAAYGIIRGQSHAVRPSASRDR